MAMNGWIHYNSGCKHTVSSSFSMPVGISSTARLTAAKSINSGISSFLYTAMGLLASIARARNDSLLILAYLRRRMDASAVKRWQKYPKCLSNVHISFHRHIFDDVLFGYLPRNENYALGRSADARFAASCNVTFPSIMADRVTINISQRAIRCAICRLRQRRWDESCRVARLWRSHLPFLVHFSRLLLNDNNYTILSFSCPAARISRSTNSLVFVVILAETVLLKYAQILLRQTGIMACCLISFSERRKNITGICVESIASTTRLEAFFTCCVVEFIYYLLLESSVCINFYDTSLWRFLQTIGTSGARTRESTYTVTLVLQ